VSTNPYVARTPARPASNQPSGLADVLERVLDKGLVIAGDIQLNLVDVEVITIKVRLLLASADTAQQMGIDWWKRDPFLSSEARKLEEETSDLAVENQLLRRRLERLETVLAAQLPEGEREAAPDDATALRDRAVSEHAAAEGREAAHPDRRPHPDDPDDVMTSRPADEWEERGDEL
jgi:hypothetical protein